MRTGFVALTLLIALLAGCSSEPTRYAVTGTVKVDGKPGSYVTLRFHPEGGAGLGGVVVADAKGEYSLSGEGNAGLPAGSYKVTFSQTLINGKPSRGGSGGKAAEKVATERENLPEKYRKPETTPETARIGGASNSFDFDLKTK
jgi:hypothetical protein